MIRLRLILLIFLVSFGLHAKDAEKNKVLFMCNMSYSINLEICRQNLLAFKAALREHGLNGKNVEISVSQNGGNPFANSKNIGKKLSENHPIIVSGSSYIQNIFASEIIKEHPVVGLITGFLPKKFNSGEYPDIFSVTPGDSHFFDAISKKYMGKGKKFLFINNTNDSCMGSRDRKALLERIKGYGGDEKDLVEYDFSDLTKKELDAIFKDIESKKYDALFFSAHGDTLNKIYTKIKKMNDGTPIIFTISLREEEFREHKFENREIVSIGFWFKGISGGENFERSIKKHFGHSARIEYTNGYDAGVVVSNLIKRIGSDKFSYKDALDSIKKNPCFSGTSRGTICLRPGGGQETNTEFFPMKYDYIHEVLVRDE